VCARECDVADREEVLSRMVDERRIDMTLGKDEGAALRWSCVGVVVVVDVVIAVDRLLVWLCLISARMSGVLLRDTTGPGRSISWRRVCRSWVKLWRV
jgi:hypothetical protein